MDENQALGGGTPHTNYPDIAMEVTAKEAAIAYEERTMRQKCRDKLARLEAEKQNVLDVLKMLDENPQLENFLNAVRKVRL